MNALQEIVRHGQELHACSILRDDITLTEAVNAIFTPQGREFCSKRGFPSLEELRALQSENGTLLKRKCVHVDEQANELLTHGQRTLIAGGGKSRVHCEGQGCYDVIIAHGAEVGITASDYAVVRVTHIGKNCKHQFLNLDKTAVLIW